MQVRKSEYYDIAKFGPTTQTHPADVLVQSYTAVSVSNSTIRFNVRAPSYRALMDSEALLHVPLKLDVRALETKTAGGGAAHNNLTPVELNASDDYGRSALITSAGDTTKANAIDCAVMYAATAAEESYVEVCLAPCREGSDGIPAKNATFCERTSGFWKSVQSCVLEINGQSISARPEEYIHLLDELMLDEQEQRTWEQGPKDQGSDGRFVGRCKVQSQQVTTTATQVVQVSDPKFELDKGMARRTEIFAERYVPDARILSHTGKYVAVVRIPFGGIFSYYRKGLGSSRKSFIPYCQNFSLLINFKPGSLQFANMFQISAAAGRPNSNASAYRMGAVKAAVGANPAIAGTEAQLNQIVSPSDSKITIDATAAPRLQVRWVNPAESVSLAPSYTLSLPKYVSYKRELTKAAMHSAAGAPCFWSSIRLETLPKVMLISCVPKEIPGLDKTYFIDDPSAAAATDCPLFALGTMRGCCSYQDTFDCLPKSANDWDSAQLKITINEKSSLCSTYSARTLYDLLLENFPRYPHSYETWRREKMIIALAPHQIPSLKMMGAYSPTSLTVDMRFKASVRHNPPVDGSLLGVQSLLSTKFTGLTNKWKTVPHVASLVMVYEDSLSLASNSAAVSSTLFSEAAMKRAPVSKGGDAPGLDGMKM